MEVLTMHYSGSTNCIKSSLMAAVSHALNLACQKVLVSGTTVLPYHNNNGTLIHYLPYGHKCFTMKDGAHIGYMYIYLIQTHTHALTHTCMRPPHTHTHTHTPPSLPRNRGLHLLVRILGWREQSWLRHELLGSQSNVTARSLSGQQHRLLLLWRQDAAVLLQVGIKHCKDTQLPSTGV